MKRDLLAPPPGRRSTIAILAPHLKTPLRNGADVYIWNKYAALDTDEWDARLIVADGVYGLTADGRWEATRRVKPTGRGRLGAAIRTLAGGLDYLSSKFITPAYLALCADAALKKCDLVVCSYPSAFRAATALGLRPERLLVETHNFDQKVYLDRAMELRGVRRLFAGLAAVKSHALLKSIPATMPLVALGPADRMLFNAMGFENVIQGRLGFEVREPRARFPVGRTPRLLFVGSLSMTMNEMALREFVAGPLKVLRRKLASPLWFGVAGSHPSRALTDFLEGEDIVVHPNPNDSDLSALVESCHATVLPFTSNNGLKLKFAYSASHGVPIMSFLEPPEGLEYTPGVLVASDMGRWAEWLAQLCVDMPLQLQWSSDLQDASARNAWPVIVARELAALDAMRCRATCDRLDFELPHETVGAS